MFLDITVTTESAKSLKIELLCEFKLILYDIVIIELFSHCYIGFDKKKVVFDFCTVQ